MVLLLLSGLALPARAQNVEILDQRLDADRQGYTVMRVWGSRYEMGHAMGAALAEDVRLGWTQTMAFAGDSYPALREALAATVWLPAGIEDEIQGLVDGVRSVYPAETMDALDVKVVNTFSDWSYYSGCRSHQAWGSFVQAPVRTLSTRRLDFGTPFDSTLHHVLCAWDPDDGSGRWVNLAWAGYVTVITGVNAQGTLVSLHDFVSTVTTGAGVVPRSVATRYVLTGAGDRPLAEQLAWAQGELAGLTVATGTFLNFYAPEGLGGVFTCASGGPCGAPRTPQADYFGGEVLITTNDQTDGHSVPGGGDFMDAYYAEGGSKDLASHFELMGTSGLHLLSVAVRGPEDMTFRAHGRGRTDRLDVEWSDLFPGEPPGPDAGAPDAGPDSGTSPGPDAGTPDAGGAIDDGGEGCGCRAAGGETPGALVLVLLLSWVVRRRR
jgi:MYXO-CTERM domain-containing protein